MFFISPLIFLSHHSLFALRDLPQNTLEPQMVEDPKVFSSCGKTESLQKPKQTEGVFKQKHLTSQQHQLSKNETTPTHLEDFMAISNCSSQAFVGLLPGLEASRGLGNLQLDSKEKLLFGWYIFGGWLPQFKRKGLYVVILFS